MRRVTILLLLLFLLLPATALAEDGGTPPPDCDLWLSLTGGEALWGQGAPEASAGEPGQGYVDLETGDCWLKTEDGWLNCGELHAAGLRLVRFEGMDGTLSRIRVTKKSALLAEPAAEELPGRTFGGWYKETGYRWDFSEDKVLRDMTLRALYSETAPLAVPRLKVDALSASYCPNEGQVGAAVVYYGCTDGPELDRERFEDLFCGEYGKDDCLRSAASYYRWNSGGKVELDFHFYYLDSGLSSAELYRQRQRAGEYYDIDDYYDSILQKALAESGEDPKALDKDGDGYLDCVILLSGEDISKTVGDGNDYYVFGGGSMGSLVRDPDPERPVMIQIISMSAGTLGYPLTPACVEDLFGPGEEFSMARCAEAFPNAPLLNNGGSFDYSVRVEGYDPETCSAIVTVTRMG